MIRDIVDFFRKEKLYAFLLGLFVLAYGALISWPGSRVAGVREYSGAVDKLKQAETRFQREVEKAGSISRFLKKRPVLERLFRLLSFVAAGAFSFGVIINLFLVFSPAWRRQFVWHPPDPPSTEWKISMIFKVILLFLLSGFVVSLMLAMVKRVLWPDLPDNLLILLQTTFTDLVCVLLILRVVRVSGGRWRDLGFRLSPKGLWREIVIGVGGYLAVLPLFSVVLVFLLVLANLFAYEPPPHPLVNVLLEEEVRSPGIVAYSMFLACFAGPIFEEIFFRGFCYNVIKKRWGMGWAVILTAAFFALIHGSAYAFWPIFVLGVGLAYVYEIRQSLAAPMALHIVHNTIFIGYFFLAKQVVVQGAGF